MTNTTTYNEIISRGCEEEAAIAAANSELDLDMEQRVFMARILTSAPTWTVSEAADFASGFTTTDTE